jgi:hypothetical protein
LADSLAAIGNLAAVLWQAGDHAKAYALQHQVVALQRRRLGDADETVGAAQAVLDMMERAPKAERHRRFRH